MAEMRKASRKQGFGVKDRSNLSASAQAAKASAAMFDQLTNSFLKISDVATTSAINAKIRDRTLEGEMEGVAGSVKDKDGSFKGYTKQTEVFKWDVASNKAAKTSFESNVTARASSSMKTLSKEVDGDRFMYDTVATRYLEDALLNVDDKQQRQHITNSYAKSYNQNMPTVATRSLKKEGDKAKSSWDDSRDAFKEDVGVVMSSFYKAQDDYRQAKLDGDRDGMLEAQENLERYAEQLGQLRGNRESEGDGGVMYGTLTIDGVKADTADDIFEGYKVATVKQYRTAETYEDKQRVRDSVEESDDSILPPNRKSEILKAIDEELAHENAMESARYTKDERDLVQAKRVTNETTRMDIVDAWLSQDFLNEDEFATLQDDIASQIDEDWAAGFLTTPERDKYKELMRNGDPVTVDDPVVYADIFNNLEAYELFDITESDKLTFQSKKELIKSWKDMNENEQWMKAPAYRESKTMIKEAFGFSEQSILPEFLDHKTERKRKEMSNLLQQYTAQVREKVLAGEVANHYEIAEALLSKARDNVWSAINKTDDIYEGVVKTSADIKRKAKDNNVTFEKALADFEEKGGELGKLAKGENGDPVDEQERLEIIEENKRHNKWVRANPERAKKEGMSLRPEE